MSDPDAPTLNSIAASAEAAAVRAGLGDHTGASAALDRATRQLNILSADRPSHARVVRLAREAVEKATQVVETLRTGSVPSRRAGTAVRRAARAAERAKL